MSEETPAVTLDSYLEEMTKNKNTFSFAALKRKFPKDKDQIKNYKFIGLIDTVNSETPDVVRAYVY